VTPCGILSQVTNFKDESMSSIIRVELQKGNVSPPFSNVRKVNLEYGAD
jgi:hypothetical protein